jgi:hypothetical protein
MTPVGWSCNTIEISEKKVASEDCADTNSLNLLSNSGAARGIRTPDPVITNDVLYQLSYCGDLSGDSGLVPADVGT